MSSNIRAQTIRPPPLRPDPTALARFARGGFSQVWWERRLGKILLGPTARGGMSSQRPARRWGKTDAALVIAAAAIVPKWSRWLNERQTERKRVEGEDGEEAEWVLYRPTSALHLAQGFGTTFGYLALLDLLVARRVVQHGQNCRPGSGRAAVGPRAWAAGPAS